MSNAIIKAFEERQRQINEEGFDAAHDDKYKPGALIMAAVCYAFAAEYTQATGTVPKYPTFHWPWDIEWFKPSKDPQRNIIISMALMAAEHDRIDRAKGISSKSVESKERQAARVAHEVNRAYCLSMGDDSQPSWEDAPEWQKESAMMGVAFHIANPDAGPEASHNSWSAHKLNDGWRWGEVKDPEAKTHPCLVAFEALPVAQQAKDYLFRAVVHAIAIDGQEGEL